VNMLDFNIDIYKGKSTDGDPLESYSGQKQEWQDYQLLRVHDGFDGAVSLHLGDCWNTVLKNGLTSFTQAVTAKETIIKFGNTMQLTHDFTVVVNATFEG